MKIAVLLTTYNRKEKTLRCLQSLANQIFASDIMLDIYLTDDNSSDGTASAVKEHFPFVNLYGGTGSLFWAGGMRATWKQALKFKHDYYLLLNDDTYLFETAVSNLLKYSNSALKKEPFPSICVGSTSDSMGRISYGGRKLTSRYWWSSILVHNKSEFVECDFANANIMLVPSKVVEEIGILSDAYTHGLADYDYTLKAKKAGFHIIVAPGFLGSCIDDHGNNWKSQNVNLIDRIRYLKSPKGLAYKEYLNFIKNHFPLSLPSSFLKLWLKTIFPFVWDRLKKTV